MDIKSIETADLVAELLTRADGLSDIDENILAEELIERNCNLEMFGRETLVESLKNRSKVKHVYCGSTFQDYGVYVENGPVVHGTGKVDILILEGLS